MQVQTRQGKLIQLQHFSLQQTSALSKYLQQLSPETKQRFAPHGFDEQDILEQYRHPSAALGFIALNPLADEVIAYAIIHLKIIDYEAERFRNYGIQVNQQDVLFAPSVADAWQGSGIGSIMLQYIREALQQFGIKRLFLWGGVQSSNEQAIKYYQKHGFQQLGSFEYRGSNEDMMLEL